MVNNINWDLLMSFFGKSPKDEDFNQFLLELGIKKRPRAQHIFERIDITKDSSLQLALCAKELYEENQVTRNFPLQTEHWYVLETIIISSDYSGILPFDIKLDMTRDQVIQLIGTAAPGKLPSSDFHYHNQFVIVADYESGDKNQVKELQITMPTSYNIEILKSEGFQVND